MTPCGCLFIIEHADRPGAEGAGICLTTRFTRLPVPEKGAGSRFLCPGGEITFLTAEPDVGKFPDFFCKFTRR